MKPNPRPAIGLTTIVLILPAAADVIYSNLQDIPIPTTYAGVYLDVDGTNGWNTNMFSPVAGWDVNPFFGGQVVANSPAFQPVRTGTGSMSPIVDFAVGDPIGSGNVFATGYGGTGYGGSQTHLGSGDGQFMAGTEGYLGFKLNNADYGWMRVVFTNDTGGAVIKDWAYDNSGSAIVTGNVLQSAVVNHAQTVTLTSASGSFTLGSPITDTGGNINHVEKTGAGTTVLTGIHAYTGTTIISNGTLLVNGSLAGGGTVTVGSQASLGGTGSIAGPVIVNGILSPGASIASLSSGALAFNDGSTFAYEMDSGAAVTVAGDLQQVLGNLTLSGTVSLDLTDLATAPSAFAVNTTLSLINYAGTWNGGFFTYATNELVNGEVFNAGLNTWRINYDAVSGGLNFATEYTGGHFVTLTAVPEADSWIALGCLVGSGICLRTRRRAGLVRYRPAAETELLATA